MSPKNANPPPVTDTPAGKPRRRRPGAQPGPQDAHQHGFYSRQFNPSEQADLDGLTESGLTSEVDMLRVAIRRLLDLSGEAEDIETGIKLLSSLGMAATRVATLLRTQAVLGANRQDEAYHFLVDTLAEINKELTR